MIHPRNSVSSSQPNFWRNPENFIADEVVSLTKRLRTSDLKKCNVILDIKKNDVIKCRDFQVNGELVTDRNYDKLLTYFRRQYPEQIEKFLLAAKEA